MAADFDGFAELLEEKKRNEQVGQFASEDQESYISEALGNGASFVDIEFGTTRMSQSAEGNPMEEFYSYLGKTEFNHMMSKHTTFELEKVTNMSRDQFIIKQNGKQVQSYSVEDYAIFKTGKTYDLRVSICNNLEDSFEPDTKTHFVIKRREIQLGQNGLFDLYADEVREHELDERGDCVKTYFTCQLHFIVRDKKNVKQSVDYIQGRLKRFQLMDLNYMDDAQIDEVPDTLTSEILDMVFSVFETKDSLFPGTNPLFFTRNAYSVIHNLVTKVELEKREALKQEKGELTEEDKLNLRDKNTYALFEKTMGVRFFLCCYSDGRCYFIDENMKVFTINDTTLSSLIEKVFGANAILEGIMTRNFATQQLNFMMYDMILIRNNKIWKEPFKTRYSELCKYYNQYISLIRGIATGESKFPFVLRIRSAYGMNQFSMVMNCLNNGPIHGTFLYQDKYNANFSNGVIFVPNLPYEPFENKKMFKWVYNRIVMVKLGIRIERTYGREIETFFCKGYGKNEFVNLQQTNFSQSDREVFNSDKRRLGWSGQGIVQCSYNAQVGRWVYNKILKDEINPDPISKVMTLLEMFAGEISNEELTFCFDNLDYVAEWKGLTEGAARAVLDALN
ncbi:mRNA guanylyltransferase, putative [Entamoeba invadens IP1]|uniref:mRNA guanylyltransferase, putative n=1 Tax=Entamoeba invadens IP1 TaxID=370355 RepID=UPI0002C3D04E|nr:mRNA guanylyltransferase, putative [Entamoeba invadens IP1]ELP90778.1 mRNA guanylyltransferase, putative [Entamoeba invadens IP1]|eukprot:XP_004257549.1 mRNA guanylyltransferase, putative [Entamoeba invadens IP1]